MVSPCFDGIAGNTVSNHGWCNSKIAILRVLLRKILRPGAFQIVKGHQTQLVSPRLQALQMAESTCVSANSARSTKDSGSRNPPTSQSQPSGHMECKYGLTTSQEQRRTLKSVKTSHKVGWGAVGSLLVTMSSTTSAIQFCKVSCPFSGIIFKRGQKEKPCKLVRTKEVSCAPLKKLIICLSHLGPFCKCRNKELVQVDRAHVQLQPLHIQIAFSVLLPSGKIQGTNQLLWCSLTLAIRNRVKSRCTKATWSMMPEPEPVLLRESVPLQR